MLLCAHWNWRCWSVCYVSVNTKCFKNISKSISAVDPLLRSLSRSRSVASYIRGDIYSILHNSYTRKHIYTNICTQNTFTLTTFPQKNCCVWFSALRIFAQCVASVLRSSLRAKWKSIDVKLRQNVLYNRFFFYLRERVNGKYSVRNESVCVQVEFVILWKIWNYKCVSQSTSTLRQAIGCWTKSQNATVRSEAMITGKNSIRQCD